MKKIIYICDKCGKEIIGLPIKLVPCSYDQYGDVTEIGSEALEDKAEKIQKNDYCLDCFRGVCDLLEPDQEEIEEEIEEELTQEEDEEICDRIENTPKRGGQTTPLDVGKIKALYKANWKAKEIAEEMRCAESAVYRHLKAMRENGEIE